MKNRMRILLFILGGAAVGYGWYLLFPCNGSCPITSSPFRTMAWFAVIGWLLSGILLP